MPPRASRAPTRERGALPTGASDELVDNRLGSGSDYTVFLNHLGIPVADLDVRRTVRRLPLDVRQAQLGGARSAIPASVITSRSCSSGARWRCGSRTPTSCRWTTRPTPKTIAGLHRRSRAAMDAARPWAAERRQAGGDRTWRRRRGGKRRAALGPGERGRGPDCRHQSRVHPDGAGVPSSRRNPGSSLVPTSDLRAQAHLRTRVAARGGRGNRRARRGRTDNGAAPGAGRRDPARCRLTRAQFSRSSPVNRPRRRRGAETHAAKATYIRSRMAASPAAGDE